MSKLTLVYEDPALRLYWHEQHAYYLAEWQPVFRKGEDLKRAYQKCLDAARGRRGAPWLADVSKVAVIDRADQQWISDWFFPEFVRAGVRYQAAVRAEREVGKISTSNAAANIAKSGTLEISVHRTRAEAEAAIVAWHKKHAND